MSSAFFPITPPPLPLNATIALISPSSRVNHVFPARVARATASLASLGFTVRPIYTHPLSNDPATAVAERVAEIHTAFRDPSIHAILCTIGGLSANELLPYLDYALIRANPKIFCGYSDITLLHHALYTQAGLRTFYGPAAITQFGDFPTPLDFTVTHWLHVLQPGRRPDVGSREGIDEEGAPGVQSSIVGAMPRSSGWTQEFLDWETGEDGSRARTLTLNAGWKWLRPGTAEGKVMGGCLPSILQLAGTKYFPDYSETILLLEMPDWTTPDSGMPLEFARSAVMDLVNAGVLGTVRGLVMGRPFHYDAETWRKWEEMLVEMCEVAGMAGPVLCGVDVGHTDPQLTVPLGAMARLSSMEDEWAVLEQAVNPAVVENAIH
ncbi:hypothetical protein MMC18_009580 [Xylographa bjoerkii]|nr:hypothetical protein [Xylographa bjoerkii]